MAHKPQQLFLFLAKTKRGLRREILSARATGSGTPAQRRKRRVIACRQKSGGPGTACCQFRIPLPHSLSMKVPWISVEHTTHHPLSTPFLSKAPRRLDANGLGAHEPEFSLPLSLVRHAQNLDVGYLNSLRWSVCLSFLCMG